MSIKLKRFISAVCLLLAVLTAASCTVQNTPSDETAAVITGEDTTVNSEGGSGNPDETAGPDNPNGEEETNRIIYGSAAAVDYKTYLNTANIEKGLKGAGCVAVAYLGTKVRINDEYSEIPTDTVYRDGSDYKLRIDGGLLGAKLGKTVKSGTPAEAAESIGMKALEYENKLVIFYKDNAPFNAFDDYYTLEALWLELTDASEEDKLNAFVTLPNLITNGSNFATYYTNPNISLGVQTSIYYEELGDNENAATGPAIVAGEGRYADNHTIVRVFNRQQICTAQFLAFPSSVTGGVQVAAAQYGLNSDEVLIAAAAYDTSAESAKCVNIFDTQGIKRMVIYPDASISAPYVIATGHFLNASAEELLLVTSEKPAADGKLVFELYSLKTGSVVKQFKLDCSFAKQSTVQISVRENTGKADGIILYFPAEKTVYEGDADSITFTWAEIQLPENAVGVYASANEGEKYVVTLTETDETKDRSFVNVYNTDNAVYGESIDVGFKENVFYSSQADNNDSAYVDNLSFQHLRADIASGARGKLNGISDDRKFDERILELTYSDYAYGGISGVQSTYRSKNVLLEPCFTHRWNGGTFNNFISYDDLDGDMLFAALGRTGNYENYLELGSSFDNGTYADGILVLAKIRLYPIRTLTRVLAGDYRGENGDTFNLIGISPVHEQEINVTGSVGDYNKKMVEGFKRFMINQYGSIENINARFGTSFKSEADMDAPRGSGRGDWDDVKSSYGDQWYLYNRNIINTRIMEAYRETLLAGFPPETISSHQIPEGDAIGGLLGDGDTRLSPVDTVMTCGTAFGATRYGTFCNSKGNFIAVAHNSGHNAIELGEYCSLSPNTKSAYKQLKYIWENGVRVIHVINPGQPDSVMKSEIAAIKQLAEENLPRPGYTGGTTDTLGVAQAGKTYNIIQIGQGTGDDTEGLLKSVDSTGKFEGTVYVVPFHSHVNVTSLSITNDGNKYTSEDIKGLQSGDQVEFTFFAKGSGKVKVEVYNAGYLLEKSVTEFTVDATLKQYRFVLSNQITPDDMKVVFTVDEGVTVSETSGVLETESVGRKFVDGSKTAVANSAPHVGGVSFDLLSRDMKG